MPPIVIHRPESFRLREQEPSGVIEQERRYRRQHQERIADARAEPGNVG
jgi:hypothetical protein